MSQTWSVKSPRPVVVAVDGSEDGDRALRYGVAEALRHGCDLRLVHVPHETVPMAPMLPMFSISSLDDIGWHVLDDAASHAKEVSGGEVTVQSVLVHAPRVTGILDHAGDAVCVVLGPRSPSVHRVVTGSTSSGVAARADCPVICVPRGRAEQEYHRVVAGIDGSPSSASVLAAAFEAAQERRASLTVLHAWRPGNLYDAALGGRQLAHAWEEQAQRDIAELLAGWESDYPDVDVTIALRYERPAVALVETADHADLLVVGRHGYGGLVGASLGVSLGSTARAMIRSAHCPVEIVPKRR